MVMNGQQLAEGNHTISDEDYHNWDGSNDSAYDLIATAINVVLIAEPIIEPVVTPTVTPTEQINEEPTK